MELPYSFNPYAGWLPSGWPSGHIERSLPEFRRRAPTNMGSSPTTGSTAAGGKDGQLGLPVVNSFNNKGRASPRHSKSIISSLAWTISLLEMGENEQSNEGVWEGEGASKRY